MGARLAASSSTHFTGEETEAAEAPSSLRPWVGPGHTLLALHWDLGSGSPAGTMAEASVSPCPSAEDNMAAKQPPPLMKKHSQTDLVSRLKTRKILGVGGEDDDGEVHRSKVGHPMERSQGPQSLRLPSAMGGE